MAHTYTDFKFTNPTSAKLVSGYKKITFADDYNSGYAIAASNINSELTKLIQLTPVSGSLLAGATPIVLDWDYANQKLVAVDLATAAALADTDALDGVTVIFYYEGF